MEIFCLFKTSGNYMYNVAFGLIFYQQHVYIYYIHIYNIIIYIYIWVLNNSICQLAQYRTLPHSMCQLKIIQNFEYPISLFLCCCWGCSWGLFPADKAKHIHDHRPQDEWISNRLKCASHTHVWQPDGPRNQTFKNNMRRRVKRKMSML